MSDLCFTILMVQCESRCKSDAYEDRRQTFKEEKELMDLISSLWDDKVWPVVVSPEGKVVRKASTLAHMVRLEAGSFKQTCQISKVMKYGLTDEGTEACVSNVKPLPVKSLIPWFHDPAPEEQQLQEVDLCDEPPEPESEPDPM